MMNLALAAERISLSLYSITLTFNNSLLIEENTFFVNPWIYLS